MLNADVKKIEELINQLNPDVSVNYDGLINGLKTVNPEINVEKVSEKYKRIMFLQLVAHSLKVNCLKISKELKGNTYIKAEIDMFKNSFTSFCDGYVDLIKEQVCEKDFYDNQTKACQSFLSKWKSISQDIKDSLVLN